MINLLSRYIQQLHYERHYWLTRHERRKAWLMALGILVCIGIVILLWASR